VQLLPLLQHISDVEIQAFTFVGKCMLRTDQSRSAVWVSLSCAYARAMPTVCAGSRSSGVHVLTSYFFLMCLSLLCHTPPPPHCGIICGRGRGFTFLTKKAVTPGTAPPHKSWVNSYNGVSKPSDMALSLCNNRITPIIITDITGRCNKYKFHIPALPLGQSWEQFCRPEWNGSCEDTEWLYSSTLGICSNTCTYPQNQPKPTCFDTRHCSIYYIIFFLSDQFILCTKTVCSVFKECIHSSVWRKYTAQLASYFMR